MATIDTRGHIATVNSKVIGTIQSIGEVKLSRDVKEYKAINIENVVLAIGTMSAGDMSIGVLYDPADSAGAGEMETALMDGTEVPFSLELSDIVTAGTGNGTTFAWSGAVVKEMDINQDEDGKVLATYTIHLNGKPTVTAAA